MEASRGSLGQGPSRKSRAVQQRAPLRPAGSANFCLRQSPPRSLRRVRAVSADPPGSDAASPTKSAAFTRGTSTPWASCRAAIRSASSSVTKPSMRAKFDASPPMARNSLSTFLTTAGLDAPPPPSSISTWRASAPWKTAAGSFARTNNGYTVSIDPYGRIFSPLPPDVRAAVDLPYDFRTDETIYTRFGDWFAWLCVLVSVILVATTFRKAK